MRYFDGSAQDIICDFSMINFWLLTSILPIILVVISGGIRKLVEMEDFSWRQFYVAPDLALASLAAGLMDILDPQSSLLHHQAPANNQLVNTIVALPRGTGAFFSFVLLVILMGVRQQYEKHGPGPKVHFKEIFVHGIVCNLIGALLMVFVQVLLRY